MNAKTYIEKLLSSGLTQKDIERRWGISQSTISHLYRGTRGKRTSHDLTERLQFAWKQREAEQVSA